MSHRFSVIILNYNGKEVLKDCLDSVAQLNHPNFEVIVFDNNSTDGSFEEINLEEFKNLKGKLKIIKSQINLGFAGGNNQAVSQADGEILFFLNNDTRVKPDVLQGLDEVFKTRSEVGIVQAMMIRTKDGFIDNLGNSIDWACLSYLNFAGHDPKKISQKPFPIFAANGAAMAVRNPVFHELKGFDPDFFLLFEETDLCWRAWLSGWQVWVAPGAIVWHLGAHSRKRLPQSLLHSSNFYYFNRNRLTSIIKNFETINAAKVLVLNLILLFLLSLAKLARFQPAYLVETIRAVQWNVINLPQTLAKRCQVQKNRLVSDRWLGQNDLVKKISFSRILSKFS